MDLSREKGRVRLKGSELGVRRNFAKTRIEIVVGDEAWVI